MKFGEKDRREFIVENSEVSLIAINNTDGSPLFLGRAKAGEPLDQPKWQIRKITYDEAGGVIRMEWPLNDENAASTDYEFIWSSFSSLTITNISQAATAVVTVSSIGDLENGDLIVIQGVEGMTQVNFDGSNVYTVANIVGSTFELQGIDSIAFSPYTGGGTVTFGEFLNYTYA
jgi:Ubiquitin-activating enzyme E1 FCCH domain